MPRRMDSARIPFLFIDFFLFGVVRLMYSWAVRVCVGDVNYGWVVIVRLWGTFMCSPVLSGAVYQGIE